MEHFNENRLRRSLSRLDPWKRITFMARCCERMLPNYEKFAADSGFGDPQVLRNAVDSVWTWLESGCLPNELRAMVERVDAQAPDTAEFASPFTSAALDAANATAILLEAIASPIDADPVEVATLARDTVYLYVAETADLDLINHQLEDAILCHPLLQAELQEQRKDIERLGKWSGTRDEAARQLRTVPHRVNRGSLALQ